MIDLKPGVLRTPDSRFENLPDYDFTPYYVNIMNLRIHYVDEGPKDGFPILLLHGEPSWSYLYRKMIPILAEAGYRVIVPDLIGFGRSDKPIRKKDYTYQKHVDIMLELVKKLDLNKITLFGQDWGGLIGLRIVAEEKDRFDRIVAANTFLPSEKALKGFLGYRIFRYQVKRQGKVTKEELQKKANFLRWVAFSQTVSELDIGDIVQGATITNLSSEIVAAYDAPFPDDSYKAGARILPMLVPSQLRKNHKAWKKVLTKWEKPFLTAFSDRDPITRGLEKIFHKRIPGAQNQPHVKIKNAGHFLQEDKGEEIARIILEFIE
ncbi:MAG: haloalkane dehalogenase [Candidatus Hodarchaeales archaeon]